MKKGLRLTAGLLAAMAISADSAHAQLVDCNVFMAGNYVQAGISPNGAFGALTPQPAGYYGNAIALGPTTNPCDSIDLTSYSLGFIADPDRDGFTIGTPPFYGDFFTPGQPFEGWSISVDSTRADAFDIYNGLCTAGMTGSNVSYEITGRHVISTWQGVYNGISINQITTIDTGALYFTLNITLINTDTFAHDDVYYLRSVDPDNDKEEPGGAFETNNNILYQRPDSLNATLVTAVGTVYADAFLALGTADTIAKCFIYKSWPPADSISLSDMYNETAPEYHYSGAVLDSDYAVGLVFHIPHLAPADSSSDSVAYRTTSAHRMRPANSYTFTYFYAFSPAAVDSALAATNPASGTGTLAVKNTNPTSVKVYPNPATDMVTITGLTAGDQLAVYDMMGKCMNMGWNAANGSNNYSLSGMPAGPYILVVKNADGTIKTRVQISKQ